MPKYTEYQKVFRIGKLNSGKAQSQPRARDRSRRPQWSSDTNNQNDSSITVPSIGQDRTSKEPKTKQNATDLSPKLSEAQRRLQHLEKVVASLVDANAVPLKILDQPTPPSSDESLSGSMRINKPPDMQAQQVSNTPLIGRLEVRGLEANYSGGTHWETILADIKDIQECLANEVQNEVLETLASATGEEPDIVFGVSEPVFLAEALEMLPSRHVTDKLLSVFFSSHHLHIPFIHRGKFLREYESFWNDPSSVPYLWISILFSALDLGSWVSYMSNLDAIEPLEQVGPRPLLRIAGQILVAGQYPKARPYSVEAVLLYGICKFVQRVDHDTEPWLVIGVAARMAVRMGYHRDPKHLPHISPFEGEMRRRTFSILMAFDLLLSFQAGLPATIHEDSCDTDLPGNLFDEDFDEDATVVPPSRPYTVPTPMIYHCFKGRLCRSFRPVSRLALSPTVPTYEETMKADAELRRGHALIPPSLAMKPWSLSITDEVRVIMHRFNVDLLYQSGIMIIHRMYLSHERWNPAYEYSRKTCIQASLAMLKWQADVHIATQPGGQLRNSKWMATSLTQHDLLLAAMIACLDLYESHRQGEVAKMTEAELEDRRKTYNALKVSHHIWTLRGSGSRDAKRASTMLGVMMAKIPDPNVAQVSGVDNPLDVSQEQDTTIPGSTTIALSNLSLWEQELGDPFMGTHAHGEQGPESAAFEALLRDEEVNWSLVDKYLFGRGQDDFMMGDL
ncbi:hypothetical protein LTR84_005133 [Exophiala bonariae]|uniref:Xylanolytic transcriptional activator regulatory domain-containing protein n=1 Tax=Exophiala bonariae TaxID=1690606 RepID=A0AAV9NSU7_9EURO|nr:hypothetical protein LTR84_005133 [Exophiala bonariae]